MFWWEFPPANIFSIINVQKYAEINRNYWRLCNYACKLSAIHSKLEVAFTEGCNYLLEPRDTVLSSTTTNRILLASRSNQNKNLFYWFCFQTIFNFTISFYVKKNLQYLSKRIIFYYTKCTADWSFYYRSTQLSLILHGDLM